MLKFKNFGAYQREIANLDGLVIIFNWSDIVHRYWDTRGDPEHLLEIGMHESGMLASFGIITASRVKNLAQESMSSLNIEDKQKGVPIFEFNHEGRQSNRSDDPFDLLIGADELVIHFERSPNTTISQCIQADRVTFIFRGDILSQVYMGKLTQDEMKLVLWKYGKYLK